MSPFFSIIISLYNKELYIENTLKSVLNQNFKNFEIIVVNDGSTDTSIDKIKSIKSSKFKIYNTDNNGVSHARNYGISLAKGRYIALLDADDYWHNNHLTELNTTIKKFPEAGIFCNNYEIYYRRDFIKPAQFSFSYSTHPILINDYFKCSRINSVIWTSSACFSKNSFETIGKFKTNLRTGQDIDLWIRYALQHEVAFNPKITMRYRNYDKSSLSKSNFNDDRYLLISSFNEQAKTNNSLKAYLDLNRYALAIRCLINNEVELYNILKKEIDYNNINNKQKIILFSPKFILKILKKFQSFLISNQVYLNAYR